MVVLILWSLVHVKSVIKDMTARQLTVQYWAGAFKLRQEVIQ